MSVSPLASVTQQLSACTIHCTEQFDRRLDKVFRATKLPKDLVYIIQEYAAKRIKPAPIDYPVLPSPIVNKVTDEEIDAKFNDLFLKCIASNYSILTYVEAQRDANNKKITACSSSDSELLFSLAPFVEHFMFCGHPREFVPVYHSWNALFRMMNPLSLFLVAEDTMQLYKKIKVLEFFPELTSIELTLSERKPTLCKEIFTEIGAYSVSTPLANLTQLTIKAFSIVKKGCVLDWLHCTNLVELYCPHLQIRNFRCIGRSEILKKLHFALPPTTDYCVSQENRECFWDESNLSSYFPSLLELTITVNWHSAENIINVLTKIGNNTKLTHLICTDLHEIVEYPCDKTENFALFATNLTQLPERNPCLEKVILDGMIDSRAEQLYDNFTKEYPKIAFEMIKRKHHVEKISKNNLPKKESSCTIS